ncbi:unnamed protein product [Cochlearia groenlandica]
MSWSEEDCNSWIRISNLDEMIHWRRLWSGSKENNGSTGYVEVYLWSDGEDQICVNAESQGGVKRLKMKVPASAIATQPKKYELTMVGIVLNVNLHADRTDLESF